MQKTLHMTKKFTDFGKKSIEVLIKLKSNLLLVCNECLLKIKNLKLLSLYVEMHDLLLLLSFINSNYGVPITFEKTRQLVEEKKSWNKTDC